MLTCRDPGPAAHKTVKTVYVVANTDSVELFLNGKSLGINSKPENGFVFAFPDVAFVPGNLRALGIDAACGCSAELTTAGPPVAIRPHFDVAPQGYRPMGRRGIHRFEVVDAKATLPDR